ncbi:MAG: hypothetical protein RPR91_04175, partial [Colwellia sp.]
KTEIDNVKVEGEIIYLDVIAYSMGCTIAISLMCWLIINEPEIKLRKFVFIAPDLKLKLNYIDDDEFKKKKSGGNIRTVLDQNKELFMNLDAPDIGGFLGAFKFVASKLDPSSYIVFYSKKDKIALFRGNTKRLIKFLPRSENSCDLTYITKHTRFTTMKDKCIHERILLVERLWEKLRIGWAAHIR